MSMIIDYKKLWEDGGYAKDNLLENTIAVVIKESKKVGLPQEAAEVIINEFFMGLASGDKYSTEKCRCGCGIDKSGTDATHEMFSRVHAFNYVIKKQLSDLLESRVNANIAGHMKRENEQYIKDNTKPGIIKRIIDKFKR